MSWDGPTARRRVTPSAASARERTHARASRRVAPSRVRLGRASLSPRLPAADIVLNARRFAMSASSRARSRTASWTRRAWATATSVSARSSSSSSPSSWARSSSDTTSSPVGDRDVRDMVWTRDQRHVHRLPRVLPPRLLVFYRELDDNSEVYREVVAAVDRPVVLAIHLPAAACKRVVSVRAWRTATRDETPTVPEPRHGRRRVGGR